MRWIFVIGCLAAYASPAWAGLDQVKAIAFDEKSVAALTRVKAIDPGVPEVTGTLVRITAVDNAVPRTSATLPAGVRVPGDLPCALALPVCGPLVGGDVPRFPGLVAAAPQEVDPFLTWLDIWSEGTLGQLRTAAVEAAKRGDDAAYRRLVAEYWAGVANATERRQVLGALPGSGTNGLRVSRRSGR